MTRSSRKPAARRSARYSVLGALSPPEQDQHVQVHRLRRARLVVRRDDHLDQQQRARLGRARDGRCAAAASPARRPSRGRSASAGAGRPPPAPPRRSRPLTSSHRSESPSAAMASSAVAMTWGRSKRIPRAAGLARRIAASRTPCAPPISATVRTAETVVDPHQLAGGQGREVAHRRVEVARLLGVLRVPVEELHPERFARHGPAGPDALGQASPGQPVPGCGLGDRKVAHRAGRIRAQRLAERGQPERAWGDLGEDAMLASSRSTRYSACGSAPTA